jgi:hypothetical protein
MLIRTELFGDSSSDLCIEPLVDYSSLDHRLLGSQEGLRFMEFCLGGNTVFRIIILSGVRLSPLGTAASTGLLYHPRKIGDGDCGEIGGMKIGRGNRSTRTKRAPAPLLSTTNPT